MSDMFWETVSTVLFFLLCGALVMLVACGARLVREDRESRKARG